MLTLAIDPGPKASGAVLYDPDARQVLWADPAAPTRLLYDQLWIPHPDLPWWGRDVLVLVERMRSQGQSGNDLMTTAEVGGRLQQAALCGGHAVCLVTRTQVLVSLGCLRKGAPGGKSRDSKVNAAVRALLGPKGTKKAPGPTWGVTSHATQALGLALAYHEAPPALRARMDEEGACPV